MAVDGLVWPGFGFERRRDDGRSPLGYGLALIGVVLPEPHAIGARATIVVAARPPIGGPGLSCGDEAVEAPQRLARNRVGVAVVARLQHFNVLVVIGEAVFGGADVLPRRPIRPLGIGPPLG